MEKQFVTYDIALKMKELGYDNRFSYINTFYYLDTKLCQCSDTYITMFPEGEFVIAPLWQQAIDWLYSKNLYIFFFIGENSKFRNVFSFCILNTHYTLVDFDFENGDSDPYIIREQAILKALELCKK